jgi:hypothetical protein
MWLEFASARSPATCDLSRDLGKGPFEDIAPAPNYFHGLWEKRSVSLKHLKMPVGHHFRNVEVALANAA